MQAVRTAGHSGTVAAVLVVLCAVGGEAAAQTDGRGTLTRQDFDALLTRVDNAGRWGGDDERGTLNLITDEIRRAAATEVRTGRNVSLARELVPGPVEGALEPASLEFLVASDTVLGPSDGSVMWTVDQLTILYHGFAYTHVDAPSHLSYHGRGYNGPAAHSETLEPRRNRVGSMRDGIVTRGVLVDLPRLRGAPFVEANTAVTVADLAAWEEQTGLRLRTGDVVLVRGGRWTAEAAAAGVVAAAALHPTAAEWLHERGAAAIGVEGSADPGASLVPGITSPFHVLALVGMGMPIFENLDLDALAAEAAARSRWSFLFVAAPLDLRGATGSPVNPLAVF